MSSLEQNALQDRSVGWPAAIRQAFCPFSSDLLAGASYHILGQVLQWRQCQAPSSDPTTQLGESRAFSMAPRLRSC